MSRFALSLLLLPTFVLASACGMMGGGLESQACKDYFAKVEECAEKANDIKADAIRKGAEISKENFEKNSNALAVQKSCEMMKEQLDNDPDCQ